MAVWRAYRLKRGSLNIGRRIEQAVGNALAMYANGNRKAGSKPLSAYDFMPHEQKPKPVEIGVEDYLMSMVGR
ncbi:hypothetical protein [Acinetobacter venetianus]|uniref:Uncharacterized protein n=1 Tax=Acinetobacter venetianus TaxID=52133 RepID=A0A150HYA2_9GAMM|nr:hypothetical protein [Acinetobacter venetianus]KXZ72135.1 hypothetical protein AVENLUH13518_00746 [Acinetobacter venetianus]